MATETHWPTLADGWRPRTDAWLARAPSPFAGRPGRPLLIGACPRSGTTLLRSMLNNHPDLGMPAETDFVIPLWTHRLRYGDLRRAENRRRVAEWILDTPGHGGQRIRAGTWSREEAIERVVAAPPTLGSIFATLFSMWAEAKGKRRWGDKRPAYAGYLGALFQLFPDAQFVNVVRDPRGSVASQMTTVSQERSRAAPSAAVNWEMAIRQVDGYAERLRPDQLLDVRYEDLVREPRAVLQRICDFAGLRSGEAIEDMITKRRRGSFREGWHTLVAEPVSTGPIDRWRGTLPPAEIALVEHVTGDWLERFGYRPVAEPAAAPDPEDLAYVSRSRAYRRRMWRRYRLGELKRRLLYRRPVAAAS